MSDTEGLYRVTSDRGAPNVLVLSDLSFPDALSAQRREFNEKGASLVSIERQA
jgi:hypothetical protein